MSTISHASNTGKSIHFYGTMHTKPTFFTHHRKKQ